MNKTAIKIIGTAHRQCAFCFEGKIIEQEMNVHHLFYEDPLVKTHVLSVAFSVTAVLKPA